MVEKPSYSIGDKLTFKRESLSQLFDALKSAGYAVIGPTEKDGAVVYENLSNCDQLPVGLADEQEAATYRLHKRDDDAVFGYRVAPQSYKRFLYTPVNTIWKASRSKRGFEVTHQPDKPEKQAFFGVRPCELNAILIQDKVLSEGEYFDSDYRNRRENTFIVAVNCTEAGNTCFCASMGTGPGADGGFDLCLTEIIDDSKHCFVAEMGTEAGLAIIDSLDCDAADEQIAAQAETLVSQAATKMGRTLDTDGLPELLARNLDNVYWDKVGRKCLSCTNCTMVCPTCFCSTVEDTTDLTGETAERTRRWDSCFTMDFSYIHGGSVRPTTKARYRQWTTHKLGNWRDQFGTPGCVGCGRCITWCPVGIDITETARVIRERDIKPAPATENTEV